MLQIGAARVGIANETQPVDFEVGQRVNVRFPVATVGVLPIIEDGIDPETERRAERNPIIAY